MKTLIIIPQYKNVGQFYELPIGMAYISAYLKHNGYPVEVFNMNTEFTSTELYEAMKRSDILCTGGLSVHYHSIRWIIEQAKFCNPQLVTVIGGGIISSMPEMIAKDLNIDIGVIGEGEQTLRDIITALNDQADIDCIPGTIIRGGDKYKMNEARSPIKNLDALPFPDYESFNVDKYIDNQLCGDEHYTYHFDKPRALPLISSRSCPYNCSFCYHPIGRVYRQRSLDNIFAEIDHLVSRYRINTLSILDELFAEDHGRIVTFCRRIKPYNLKWMAQMRVDSVNRDLMGILRESGCFQISFGIESASNVVLKSMNKHISIEQTEQALEWAYQAGIGIQGNLIFGDKSETLDTANETLNWWRKHTKYAINLCYVIPYPGSALHEHAVTKGLIPDSMQYVRNGCPFIKIPDQFDKISQQIEHARAENRIPAMSYKYYHMGTDRYKGDLFEVQAVCPHCKSANIYRNIYWGSTGVAFLSGHGYRIGCQHCNQRFDLPKFNQENT